MDENRYIQDGIGGQVTEFYPIEAQNPTEEVTSGHTKANLVESLPDNDLLGVLRRVLVLASLTARNPSASSRLIWLSFNMQRGQSSTGSMSFWAAAFPLWDFFSTGALSWPFLETFLPLPPWLAP